MIGTSTPKVQLLLELKSKMKAGMQKVKQEVNADVASMKGKLNELKGTAADVFGNLAGMGGFGSSLSSMVNPLTIIVGLLTTFLTLGG